VAQPAQRAQPHPGLREPTTHAEAGDRPSSTDLELPALHHIGDPPIGSSPTTCDLASHARLQKWLRVATGSSQIDRCDVLAVRDENVALSGLSAWLLFSDLTTGIRRWPQSGYRRTGAGRLSGGSLSGW